jgi:hypothetical protein
MKLAKFKSYIAIFSELGVDHQLFCNNSADLIDDICLCKENKGNRKDNNKKDTCKEDKWNYKKVLTSCPKLR